MSSPGSLPAQLPDDPFPLFEQWYKTARDERVQPNPDAMVVASATRDAQPSARVVLCRRLIRDARLRRVLHELCQPQRARDRGQPARRGGAALGHARSPGAPRRAASCARLQAESDEYFASRPLDSRIGAWASLQSEPLESRAGLLKRVAVMAARYGTHVPRPPHWGGYRLWPDAMELWVEGAFRVHDRARWTRSLEPDGPHAFACGAWQATRLFP